jgi:hypothetical protein
MVDRHHEDHPSRLTRPESRSGSQAVGRRAAIGCILGFALLFGINCATAPPAASPETESGGSIIVPKKPRIVLKREHRSMREEMKKSFALADEIIIGIYTGIPAKGPEGKSFYFDRFRTFDKTTWEWGTETDALLPVLFEALQPEIITHREFKELSDLDKIGICWDDFEGPRIVYLVEGVPTLVFMKHIVDETDNTSQRILIDTYPETRNCRAKDVFDLMLRDQAGLRSGTSGR